MKRFYFILHECGSICGDDEGRQFPGENEAIEAAIRGARSIMAAEVREGRLCLGCAIVIEDEYRQVVRRIAFRDTIELSGL